MSYRQLLAASALPLVLVSCSSHSSTSSPSPTPSATQGSLPVATSYVVTAKAGVTATDLRAALDRINKIPGLRGASLLGNRRLRVDLAFAPDPRQRQAVLKELLPLGIVTVP